MFMKRFLCVVLCACLLAGFAACGPKPAGGDLDVIPPAFITLDEARAMAEDFVFYSEQWWVWARPDYIFAYHGGLILRYDIAKNDIDRAVDIGYAAGSYREPSFSADGQACVTWQSVGIDSKPVPGQRYVIDFTEQTIVPTDWEAYPPNYDTGCRVEDRYHPKTPGYDFYGKDGSITEITLLQKEDLGWHGVIDEARIGALMPADPDNPGAMGDYKFVVIDVASDTIAQECAIYQK